MARLSALCALAMGIMFCVPPTTSSAEGERPGAFDYYVLALSWTPSWCAAEGDARSAPECETGQGRGFSLHGLWPQYDAGWPAFCPTSKQPPSRSETAAMTDIMGSAGLAWYQWRKHGACSGLDGTGYLAQARAAYDSITRPEILRRIPRTLVLDPAVIEAAFLEDNPTLTADSVTVTCRDRTLHEVRICLATDLTPRTCGQDVIRDCASPAIDMAPIR